MGATASTRNQFSVSNLPSEWIVTLLSEWLDIRDVAHIDTAMTMHSQRAAFLQILRQMRSTSIIRKYNFESFPTLCWLSSRQIYLEDIELETYRYSGGHKDRINSDQLKVLKLISLKKLVLTCVDDLGIFYSIRNSPLLQSIDIDNDNTSQEKIVLTDLGLHCLGSLCPALESFSLATYHLGQGSMFTAEVMSVFFRGCRSLKTVKLTAGALKNFSAFDIESLRPFGHLFEALTFPCRYPVSSSSPPSVGRMKAFADLLAQCPNLKNLVLENNHEVEYAHEGQDNSVLVSLARHCPLVEEIQLDDTARCPDAGLLLLSQNCKNLIEMRFCQCDGFTDKTFEHIAKIQSLKDLKFYNCSDITDAGVAALMRGCPNLRVFHICDEASSFSAEAFRGLRNAPFVHSLVDINITGDMEDAEEEPFEVTVGESLAYCHNLVKIRVCNDNFGDVGLALMCAGCRNLEKLEVYMSENLTIEGLVHVATSCPRLRVCAIVDVSDQEFSEAENEMFTARFPAIHLLHA